MSQVSLIDGHDDAVMQGDLISRSALHQVCYRCYEKAMRDAKGEITPMQLKEALLAFEKAIKAAPAVDAVEVVRCRDCKHWDSRKMECQNDALSTDNEGGASYTLNFYEDDFCSYGERRVD